MKQRTIKQRVEVVGIGLHKGRACRLALEPLDENMGIVFFREDVKRVIPLSPENVTNTTMATVVGKDGIEISTVEHLLAAVYAYGIDNLKIVVDSGEIPVMDGSSSGFCLMIEEAGIKEQSAPKKVIRIKEEIVYEEDGKYVKLLPYNGLAFEFEIKFAHPVIGNEKYFFEFGKKSFLKEIARARTFGFLSEVQYLRSKGLALGGSLDNAVVLDEKRVLNSEGLRYKDEFVRHKILDAIGDMAILGLPLIGKYSSFAGSHYLNCKIREKLLRSQEKYEIIETEKKTGVISFEKVFA